MNISVKIRLKAENLLVLFLKTYQKQIILGFYLVCVKFVSNSRNGLNLAFLTRFDHFNIEKIIKFKAKMDQDTKTNPE